MVGSVVPFLHKLAYILQEIPLWQGIAYLNPIIEGRLFLVTCMTLIINFVLRAHLANNKHDIVYFKFPYEKLGLSMSQVVTCVCLYHSIALPPFLAKVRLQRPWKWQSCHL